MIETKLKSLLAKQLGITSESIASDASLINDLNADSLDLVEIVMSIEKNFSIKLEDNEYAQASTVDKIVKLIESKLVV